MYRKQKSLSQEQFVDVIPTKFSYIIKKRERERRWAIVFKSCISFSCPRGSAQLVKQCNIEKHILTQTHTKTSQLLTEKVKNESSAILLLFFLAEPD